MDQPDDGGLRRGGWNNHRRHHRLRAWLDRPGHHGFQQRAAGLSRVAPGAGPAGRGGGQQVRHHPGAGPGLYAIGDAHRSRHRHVAARTGIHRIVARAGQFRGLHHVPPRAAQLRGAVDGAGDLHVRLGHPVRKRAVVPGPGRAASGADLGQYAGLGQAVPGASHLPVHSARHMHRSGAAGHQPAGRRGTRPAGSPYEESAVKALVSVAGLTITVGQGGREIVKRVSFEVAPGERVGIVGESGSGKTQAARAVIGLTPPPLVQSAGSILFDGIDIAQADAATLRALRGARIGMVCQEPMTSLNPSMSIGRQLDEGLALHRRDLDKKERTRRILDMLARVGIRDPQAAMQAWPHEFSGGMRQRMMLASVMLLEPDLLIADEPTTALDAVVQRDVLELMAALAREHGTAVLMISHDLPMVACYTERIVVMEKGEVVESGDTATILATPRHPYTRKLLDAMPRRAPARPPVAELPVVEVRNLVVDYAGRQRLVSRSAGLRALKGIDLQVRPREVVAVVGGSGSGKTTLGRVIAGLLKPSLGDVLFRGQSIRRGAPGWRDYRMNCQMVFQ